MEKKNKLTNEHYEVVRIPERYRSATIKNISDEKVREVIYGYMKNLDENLSQGRGFLFWGLNGVGKTSAAVVIAKEARVRMYPCLFITAESLRQLSVMRERDSLFTKAHDISLLILDDLGKEHSGATGATERLFENLFRVRSASKLATIVTTNMDIKAMHATYKISMMEVIKSCLLPLRFKGENHRDREAQELRKAIGVNGVE
jgi:DNA replication protein DnaC